MARRRYEQLQREYDQFLEEQVEQLRDIQHRLDKSNALLEQIKSRVPLRGPNGRFQSRA